MFSLIYASFCVSYVAQTRLELSDMDTCPCVGLDNILKNLHVFLPKISVLVQVSIT